MAAGYSRGNGAGRRHDARPAFVHRAALWLTYFGDAGQGGPVLRLTPAADGGAYVTGYTSGVRLAPTPVTRTRSWPGSRRTGERAWVRQFGGAGEDKAFAVAAVAPTASTWPGPLGSPGSASMALAIGRCRAPSSGWPWTAWIGWWPPGRGITAAAYTSTGQARLARTAPRGRDRRGGRGSVPAVTWSWSASASGVFGVPAGGQDVVVLRFDRKGKRMLRRSSARPGRTAPTRSTRRTSTPPRRQRPPVDYRTDRRTPIVFLARSTRRLDCLNETSRRREGRRTGYAVRRARSPRPSSATSAPTWSRWSTRRKPDPSRGHGPAKDGVGLWWKVLGRNKRTVTLDLSDTGRRGAAAAAGRGRRRARRELPPRHAGAVGDRAGGPARRQPAAGDRPGQRLRPDRPVRRAGPGFGTLAEAMSGFAAATGEPDGPPTLPPFGLADSVTALATAYAVMLACGPGHRRRRARWSTWPSSSRSWRCSGRRSPGTTSSATSSPGSATGRTTTRRATPTDARTGAGWRCRPARRASPSGCCGWSAGPSWSSEPWFASGAAGPRTPTSSMPRSAPGSAHRDRDEVVAAFEAGTGGGGPGLRRAGHPHRPAVRGTGYGDSRARSRTSATVRMQNVPFRMSGTPGEIRIAGRRARRRTPTRSSRELGCRADEMAAAARRVG